MNLTKEQLEMLSDCILSKMKEVSSMKPVTEALTIAINAKLNLLRELNSVICAEVNKIQVKSNNANN